MVRRDSENCHLNLSLSSVCIMVFPGNTRLLFDVSAVDSVKHKLSGKECDKVCHEPVIMLCLFLTMLWVIVAVQGRTHLLFNLTFSIKFFESGAARTTELSLMMFSVICMSSKMNPD